MPTTDSAVETTAKYTWEQIHERVGEPTAQDLEDYALATPASALVEMGNKIRSARILTDLLRWSGQLTDWLAQASPEDEQALGLDRGLLRVAVREASALRTLTDSASGSSASTQATLVADKARLEHLQDEGRKVRDQLRGRLSTALQGSNEGKASIENAHGVAPDARALAASLRRLALLARAVLDAKGPAANRLTRAHIDVLLAGMAERVQQLETLHDRTHGASTQAVPQATIDAQDGRCLLRMEAIKDVVDSGRASVPSAPVLTYLATAHYFRANRRQHAPEPTPAPTP